MSAINSRDIFIKNIVPRLLTQTYKASDLYISLEGTNIIVKPAIEGDLPKYIKNFSIKLWRQGEYTGTYTSDWWNNSWDSENMLSTTTLDIARFNLLNLSNTPLKRISQNGINYQIACRVTDTSDNLSSISILGSIRLKTISE